MVKDARIVERLFLLKYHYQTELYRYSFITKALLNGDIWETITTLSMWAGKYVLENLIKTELAFDERFSFVAFQLIFDFIISSNRFSNTNAYI